MIEKERERQKRVSTSMGWEIGENGFGQPRHLRYGKFEAPGSDFRVPPVRWIVVIQKSDLTTRIQMMVKSLVVELKPG